MMPAAPDDPAFLEQALRYLDGKLGAEEAHGLERALESDPARMRRFAALVMQRVQLSEMGRGAGAVYGRRPARRGRAGYVVAGVAGAAFAAGIAIALVRPRAPEAPAASARAPGAGEPAGSERVATATPARPAPPRPEPGGALGARVEAAQGDVAVVAEGRRAPARAGHVLADGEGLAVGADRARATVRIEGRGTLDLAAGTTLGATSAGVVPVAQGRIHAEHRDGEAAALTLATPLAEVRASSAARFRLDVRPDETRVEVHRGAVRVTAFATGRAADLGAGALATLVPERDVHVEREEPPLPSVFALQADPRELPVIRRMPEKLLVQLRGWPIDKEGFLSPNRSGFRCAGEQRHALPGMAVGAALGNRTFIDEAFRTVDATIRFQDADGSFLDTLPCDADFLGELAHALVVLVESEWERAYRRRINALVPRLQRTAQYLAAPARVEELKKYGAELTKAYVLQGAGFAFMGVLLEDAGLQALGRGLVDLALARQRTDGAFVQDGGIDANYQAITLGHLGWVALRFRDARTDAAVRAAGAWLLGRVTSAGELDITGGTRTGPDCKSDKCIGVDWQRDAWGLLYYGVDRDPRGVDAALRLFERKRAITR